MPYDQFIGDIAIFAGDYPPPGWLLCDGQILPIDKHQALYCLIGAVYGGDGKTTFAVPDLRGRVLVQSTNGANLTPSVTSSMPGTHGGSEVYNIPPRPLPQHTHTATFAGGYITPLSVEIAVSKNAGTKPDADDNLLATYRSTPSATPGNLYVNPPDAGPKGKLAEVKFPGGGPLPVGKVKVDPAGQQSVSETPLNIMQPWLALNYMIATTGMFPFRS